MTHIKKFKSKMTIGVIALEVLILSAFIAGLRYTWLAFFITLPIYLSGIALIAVIFRRNIKYLCPDCGTKFSISGKNPFYLLWILADFIFSIPPKEQITCPKCNHKNECEEIFN